MAALVIQIRLTPPGNETLDDEVVYPPGHKESIPSKNQNTMPWHIL